MIRTFPHFVKPLLYIDAFKTSPIETQVEFIPASSYHECMIRIPILLLLLCSVVPVGARGQDAVRGVVSDSVTGEPLIAANIRVLGTSRGTITNSHGAYILTLGSGEYRVVYSYLAYIPETLAVTFDRELVHNVRLQPSPVQIPEVVVLAEDPALEIIRKAIVNKRKWMGQLKSYRFDAFTRQVLRRDTAIAGITESYSTGYAEEGDTLREIVKQKRQTENIPSGENFAAVRRIVNFNEDEVDLFSVRMNDRRRGYRFVGPTAPDALDYYDYKLLNTRSANGIEIYEIRMTPKSRIRPLFDGTIMIADQTFAVVGVDVRPNETFTMPFIRDIDLRYQQQFALYDSVFWMPADIRITGGLTVSIVGFSLPRIGIEQLSSIYDYTINIPIPDSIRQKRRLSVDSSAVATFDSTFWKTHEVVPLTRTEASAYRTLDTTQTLDKQFKPGGVLGALGESDGSALSLLENIDFHFNRVEGFFIGAKMTLDSLSPYLQLEASAGQGFSDDRFKYDVAATLFLYRARTLALNVGTYRRMEHVPDGGYYGALPITLMALIDKNDYRDYYLARGSSAAITFTPTRAMSSTIAFVSEEQSSVESATSYSFFSRHEPFRLNPSIVDGTLRSLRFDLRIGREREMLDLLSRDAVELSVEHASPISTGSDFDFTRYQALVTFSVATFSRDLLFPPTFRVQGSGGIAFGTLPPQRIFTLDARSSGYAPFGVLRGSGIREFQGDAYAMVNFEHNFRSVPFLLLDIPFLYKNGVELVTHASFAQTWNGSLSTSSGWYAETGIGISRIFDLLRADLTYRFREPRRFYFSLSVATLF